MPKSKRDKKVSLTKTTKKGKELKHKLIENIRKNLEEFDSVYVFTVHNMRNAPLQEVREDWKGSRFFFAKKKIMAIALGKNKASEAHKNVHKIAKLLSGQCGLLFTNKSKDYVVEWFQNFSKMDFAKSGFVATRTVTLPAGPLPDFSHAIEPHLRSLGLPTRLEKGVIVLREEHTVCTEGTRLKPEEASVLKLLGDQMAEFQISLLCKWSKDGSFEKFKGSKKSNCTVSQDNELVKLNKNNKKRKEKSEGGEWNTADQGSLTSTQQSLTDDDEIIEPMTNLTTSEPNQDVKIPEEQIKTPKKKKRTTSKMESSQSTSETPMEDDSEDMNTPDLDIVSPKFGKKTEEQIKTPKKKKRTSSKMESSQSTSETPMEDDSEDMNTLDLDVVSPKFGKENPRRSMRTPKPIKRTPDQAKHSVKKLTVTAKKVQKSTPRGTLKRPIE